MRMQNIESCFRFNYRTSCALVLSLRGKKRARSFRRVAYLLGTLAIWAASPASAQISIGDDSPADERGPGSGYLPGDAGYWIGGSDGFIYDCWSEDRPSTGEWGLFCRTYQNGEPVDGPVQIVQSFESTVFFPQGCASADGTLFLIWSGNGRLFFSRSIDQGQSWIEPMRIDRGTDSVARAAEPRMACNGANVFVVWKDSRDMDGHVYSNRSSDWGESWQPADARIDAIDGEVQGYRYGPLVAADAGGNVYVAWVKNGHLYATVSNDGGESWNTGETQLDQLGVPDPGGSRPSIAVVDDGHAYVAWTSVNGQMYLNRSADFGANWLPAEQRISDRFALVAPAGSVTADSTGHVYGVWYYQAPDASVLTVRFNASSDDGVTWQGSDTLLGTTGVGLHPFIPHLASDNGGGVYVIWLRYIAGGTTRHIYGNASFDYGTTWEGGEVGFQVDSAPEPLDINAHEPFVGCDQGGIAGATWIDRRDPRQMHLFINTFGLP